ncbi:MAG: glutamine-dependent NAD(+) synthetase [Geoglossum simile]|nr:MAG: glutamine-dependent NAD(+) synthetase [Geoglossum simile]
MGHLATLATCSLNQWALDFQGNAERILESIRQAKAAGARVIGRQEQASLRIGPELEITGYGYAQGIWSRPEFEGLFGCTCTLEGLCLDHFLESDTALHAWESLVDILNDPASTDILLDIGMPITHKLVKFPYTNTLPPNSRQCFGGVCTPETYLFELIRPKLSLANDGNYREMRYFSPWKGERVVEDYYLPRIAHRLTGQKKVRIGDALISTLDSCMGTETCEELFTPKPPGLGAGLDGCEIFSNSSGSHHELRKLHTRIDLIRQETLKSGGIYLYANQQGCDGDRLYYDGSAMIIINGKVVAQGSQFSLAEVEVVTATVDLEEVRSYRSSKSRAMQATQQPAYERIEVDMSLSKDSVEVDPLISPSPELEIRFHKPEEEIAFGPACWMWDYLRRSQQAGFFLPLSGGIDSCATAVIVHSMTRLVYKDIIEDKNPQVLKDLLRIVGEPSNSTWRPGSPADIASRLFHTAYFGMAENSSPATRNRAKGLAKDLGAYHLDLNIDTVVNAMTTLFSTVTKYTPQYKLYGGSWASNLALQNIQARLRMVLSYLFAQLLPTVRGRNAENPETQQPGSLLVLGSANVDESLRGYLTKYDCSSADINVSPLLHRPFIIIIPSWVTVLMKNLANLMPAYRWRESQFFGAKSPENGKFQDHVVFKTWFKSKPIISKNDLKKFILWSSTSFSLPILKDFIDAPPTAELEPITDTYTQSDEADMGMSYNELSIYGRLRKIEKLGPYGMWSKLIHTWGDTFSPQQTYEKVRWFFRCYSINRHKMTTLTPSYHAEAYSPDDNRFDLRPFLYPGFEHAYKKIEKRIAAMGVMGTKVPEGVGAEGKKTV